MPLIIAGGSTSLELPPQPTAFAYTNEPPKPQAVSYA